MGQLMRYQLADCTGAENRNSLWRLSVHDCSNLAAKK